MDRQRIGFVGLGVMGSGMVRRLLAAGFEVAVFNRSADKAAELAPLGARLAASPGEAAASSDVVLISVATADAVRAVLTGDDGVLAAAAPGTVIADLSTVSPDAAREFATMIAGAGHRPLDARVLGNGRHAEQGELRFMIGGEATDVDALKPVLDVLAKDVVHLGGHGLGAVAKVALNMLMGVQLQAMSEAVVLGVRAGLNREQLIEMIVASGYSSPMMRFKGQAMLRRDYQRADFRLSLMRKDLMLAMTEAQRLAVPLPAVTAAYEMLTAALNDGSGELDCAAVLGQVEKAAGIQR
ncbi:NAD(P)-dependent oxidoreductase [Actinoplanes sp. NPDC051411]|uniref:NAD(P)-dependent oxidoreductase n=1 Tax=Actinoplanes sp. NPDC051411 TaxID=3155522 RepID=UPI003447B6EC